MNDERYKIIISELNILINNGISISNQLANKRVPLDREIYMEKIFTKLLCHAIALKKIVPSGLKPSNKDQAEIWDVSSACVLARALIESYDAMFYIAIDRIMENEREFRILLWKLHSEERRLKKLEKIGPKAPQVKNINKEVKELRSIVKQHIYFSQLHISIKKKIDKKDAPAFYLAQAERNSRASIDQNYYTACIMHLSSYVHTHPFSIHQLMEFKAGESDSLLLMSLPIQ